MHCLCKANSHKMSRETPILNKHITTTHTHTHKRHARTHPHVITRSDCRTCARMRTAKIPTLLNFPVVCVCAAVPMHRTASGTLSTVSSLPPFLNSDSIGNMTRTYLTMAVRLKIERHGGVAREIAKLDSDAARLEGLVSETETIRVVYRAHLVQ